jgi:hypothetical protein
MSFSKTISVVAALASIFSVGVASWKMSEGIKSEQTAPLEEKIQQLEKQLEETKQSQVTPQPVILPTPTPQVAPPPTQLPPTPPPPVTENVTP